VASWNRMLGDKELTAARFVATMNAALEFRCMEDTLDTDLVGTVLGLPGLRLRYDDAVKILEPAPKRDRPRKAARTKV
jgi:hypothetical protein